MRLRSLPIGLFILAITTSCGEAATPTSTSTPGPTATLAAPATPPATATLPPLATTTPIVLVTTSDVPLYTSPDSKAVHAPADIPAGSSVEPLGTFGDFVEVEWKNGSERVRAFIPASALDVLPTAIRELSIDEVPWITLNAWTSGDSQLVLENATQDWVEKVLQTNLRVPGTFQVVFEMQEEDNSGIFLVDSGKSQPWWSGLRRLEIMCSFGSTLLRFRDGMSEWASPDRVYPSTSEGTPLVCRNTLRFDAAGKNIAIMDADHHVLDTLAVAEMGDFDEGLFLDGRIHQVVLAAGPKASSRIQLLKVEVAPDGIAK